ncbi:ejaculatory bulb-specific protein 3-like [Cataglyphis hispanica]|uniref:ejaculatory bulb-specific protein 3-like n=1 Tax=Cataglyphis hispanica TaxID=1086592 RepID=UPI00217FACAD|nr:ejaculatory bulb-specific protein 3-like [Cataglyphis hispanica]
MARLNYIVVIISVALTCILAEELYSSRYDDINAEAIFSNPKLRQQYYKCFMDLAPCRTADAKFFKEVLPEALQTECRRCTEKQKQLLDYMIDWYTTNNPAELQELIAKSLEDLKKKNAK